MVVGCTEAWQACIEAWLELVEVRKQAWVETEEACKMALVVAASSVVGVACMRDALVVGVVACMMDVEGVEHCSWVPEEEQ